PQAGVEIAFEPAELLPRVEGPGARSAFGTAAAGQGEDGDEREQRTPDARWEHGFPFEVHGLAARSARSLLAPADRFTITRSLLRPPSCRAGKIESSPPPRHQRTSCVPPP